MSKIMIVGNCGSGKSTFARTLGNVLNRKVTHLDKLYWKKGWVRMPSEEWEPLMKELVKEENWIIDGNYNSTVGIRLQAADLIIYFNLPKYICLYRIFKRYLLQNNGRQFDKVDGLGEKVDWGLIKWILCYPKKEMEQQLEQYKKAKQIYTIYNSTDAKDLIKVLQRN